MKTFSVIISFVFVAVVLISLSIIISLDCKENLKEQKTQFENQIKEINSNHEKSKSESYLKGWIDGNSKGYYDAVIDCFYKKSLFLVQDDNDTIIVWQRGDTFPSPAKEIKNKK